MCLTPQRNGIDVASVNAEPASGTRGCVAFVARRTLCWVSRTQEHPSQRVHAGLTDRYRRAHRATAQTPTRKAQDLQDTDCWAVAEDLPSDRKSSSLGDANSSRSHRVLQSDDAHRATTAALRLQANDMEARDVARLPGHDNLVSGGERRRAFRSGQDEQVSQDVDHVE
jgi:hypothetical protein